MNRKISTVLFWALILICVVALLRLSWRDWREYLWIAVFVVPVVAVTNRFQNRFAGRKKRMAVIMVCSVAGAIISGGMLYWDQVLLGRGSSMGYWASGAILLVCCSVLIRSLFRLCRPANKLST